MHRLGFALLIAAACVPALAQPETAEEVENIVPEAGPQPYLEAETATGLWLLLQRSGQIAGTRYQIPGKVATLSYQRYLNSFRYPIPALYNFRGGSASAGTGGTAGGAGAAGGGAGTGR